MWCIFEPKLHSWSKSRENKGIKWAPTKFKVTVEVAAQDCDSYTCFKVTKISDLDRSFLSNVSNLLRPPGTFPDFVVPRVGFNPHIPEGHSRLKSFASYVMRDIWGFFNKIPRHSFVRWFIQPREYVFNDWALDNNNRGHP